MVNLSDLRIAFVAGTLGQGGAERQLYYNLRVLRQSGAQIKVYCLTRGEFWEEPIQALGVPVHWIGASSSRIRRLMSLWLALRHSPVHIVQSQHFFVNAYAAVGARMTGAKSIGAVRSNGQVEYNELGNLGGRLSSQIPDILAANSEYGLKAMLRLGVRDRKLFFLPNVTDTELFSPADNICRTVGLKLLFVGQLEPKKRPDRFLRVVGKLLKKLSCTLIADIYGEGTLATSLTKEAEDLKISSCIHWRGCRDNVISAYRDADCLLLTSDCEGTPNVVIEAMACGLPVVATRVGGVPEVVQEGVTGYLFEPDNEAGMAKTLVDLAQNPLLRLQMGRNARQRVIEKHSLEALPKHLRNLYSRVS